MVEARKFRWRVFALVLCGALALSGCRGESEPEAKPAASVATHAAQPAQEPAQSTPMAAAAASPGEKPWWSGTTRKEWAFDDDISTWLDVEPELGEAPLTVKIHVESMIVKDIKDLNARVAWDFGDGSPMVFDKFDLEHTYTTPGEYSLVVKMIDAINQRGYSEQTIQVLPPGGLETRRATLAAMAEEMRTRKAAQTPTPASK